MMWVLTRTRRFQHSSLARNQTHFSCLTFAHICANPLHQAVRNRIVFRYVLNDVWFASAENMRFIKLTVEKEFVMPLKSNRKIALSVADKKQGRYVQLGTLDLKPHTVREIYLEGVEFPLLLVKQVFVNEDGSTGVLYLVTSDTSLTWNDITTIYRKRWNVEPYHSH